jgi:hypothetical protein
MIGKSALVNGLNGNNVSLILPQRMRLDKQERLLIVVSLCEISKDHLEDSSTTIPKWTRLSTVSVSTTS